LKCFRPPIVLFAVLAGDPAVNLAANPAMAAGTNSHEMASQHLPIARAGVPMPSMPPPSEFLTGCGRGRYRDARTHGCVGPADIGR
jgi:hypothetical protein